MSRIPVDEKMLAYVESMSSPEFSYLAELNRETYTKVLSPQMLSGHLQGRVLSMLAYMIQPKYILEIGTYTGYSALCMAEGLVPGGMLHTIDINDELNPMVQRYIAQAGMQDRITCHLGRAADIIPTLPYTWDMVFIDADKTGYPAYYDLVFEQVRPGGYIISDNVLAGGKVTEPENAATDKPLARMLAFNKKLQDDERVENVIFPIRDGLNVVRKK
ncbi:MAG: O-methyltransferase [Bacteroidota bacterium]